MQNAVQEYYGDLNTKLSPEEKKNIPSMLSHLWDGVAGTGEAL
jgi:hypothetical protein